MDVFSFGMVFGGFFGFVGWNGLGTIFVTSEDAIKHGGVSSTVSGATSLVGSKHGIGLVLGDFPRSRSLRWKSFIRSLVWG